MTTAALPDGVATSAPRAALLARGAMLLVVLAAAAALAWLTWPRPDVALEVDRGGLGWVVGRGGRAALPETIVVAARGRPTVRIANADTAAAQLGIFTVPPGQTVEFTLPGPGSYGGYCSAHAQKKTLTFVVE